MKNEKILLLLLLLLIRKRSTEKFKYKKVEYIRFVILGFFLLVCLLDDNFVKKNFFLLFLH